MIFETLPNLILVILRSEFKICLVRCVRIRDTFRCDQVATKDYRLRVVFNVKVLVLLSPSFSSTNSCTGTFGWEWVWVIGGRPYTRLSSDWRNSTLGDRRRSGVTEKKSPRRLDVSPWRSPVQLVPWRVSHHQYVLIVPRLLKDNGSLKYR